MLLSNFLDKFFKIKRHNIKKETFAKLKSNHNVYKVFKKMYNKDCGTWQKGSQ